MSDPRELVGRLRRFGNGTGGTSEKGYQHAWTEAADTLTTALDERDRLREAIAWALEIYGMPESERTLRQALAPEKPSDCTCQYPERVMRSGSGHMPGCPAHQRWARRALDPQEEAPR